MSALLPAAATGPLPLLASVADEVAELLAGGFQDAPGLVPGPALLHVADEPGQALLVLADVQAVDRLREAQVRVDARDHDAHLDAHQRDPHVGVDHHALVQDRVDHVGEPGWLRPLRAGAAGLDGRGHRPAPPRDAVRRVARGRRSASRAARPACWPRRPSDSGSSPGPSSGSSPAASSASSGYSSRSSSSGYSSSRPASSASSASSASVSAARASGSPCSSSPASSPCSSARAVSWSLTTSPSLISPRQPSISSGWSRTSVMTCRRKCFSSRRARRPWARQMLPVCSNSPCGWYSSTSRMRVRSGVSSWKVTAPSTWPFWPLDRQTMCESGTCSMVVDSQVLCDQKTCAFQFSLLSSSVRSTFSTFFMNLAKSGNWVHWLYTRRRGAPTSIDSTMLVSFSFLPPPRPPFLPNRPRTFSFSPDIPAPSSDRAGPLPWARSFAPVTAAIRPGPPPPST